MAKDPIFSPLTKRSAALPADLKMPAVSGTTDTMLEFALRQRLRPEGQPEHALGRMETLVLQMARVQNGTSIEFDLLAFDSPQLVVFAADHGIADEGMSSLAPTMTEQMVMQLLRGQAPVNALADLHGFDLTVVDAGMAKPISPPSDTRQHGSLLLRKIGYGTRNLMLGPAMSTAQAVSAVHAGMDVVRHLPGNVIALGDVGVANSVSAAMLLSRLCGVPLVDAFSRDDTEAGNLDDTQHVKRVEKLSAAASKHRNAIGPFEALAALGGFEIAMMTGAMLQAASERRVVLVDGYVAGAAALVARGLCPDVVDYLVFTHRAADAGHRLLLIHMQSQPLLDMGLRLGQGTGALLAWPMLLAAQSLLER
jgi:nicotinate-nucleotide--dimethylbenzimidazole phosphoribosyltransferase